MSLYKSCEEIPLYLFIEIYKGKLDSVVKSDTHTDEEIRIAAYSIVEEYNNIITNRNLSLTISNQNKMVDFSSKISVLEAAMNMINEGMIEDAIEIAGYAGIKPPVDMSESSVEGLKKSIESSKAFIRLRMKMLESNMQETREKKDRKDLDFTKERVYVSTHFKMRIDPITSTAAEYAHLVRIMINEIEEMKRHGK